MSKRVVITGLGVVSSIGIGWQEFWAGLLAGKSGISPITSLDTAEFFTHNGGEVKQFTPAPFIVPERLPSLNRATQMAVVSTELALHDARLTKEFLANNRVGVSQGTTTGAVQTIESINDLLLHGRPVTRERFYQLPTHSPPSEVGKRYATRGPSFMFSTACAAGNYAIGYGYDLIRMNRADLVLAGASDPFSRISFTNVSLASSPRPSADRT